VKTKDLKITERNYMSSKILSARRKVEMRSGRISVPVGILEHAGFAPGSSVSIQVTDGTVKLSRSHRAFTSLTVDTDGRIKLSPTVLSNAGFRKRTFNFSSNGRTITVA